MAKVISAEAVISAKDNTGNTFSNIANKLKAVTSAAKSLSGAVGSGVGGLNHTIGKLQGLARTIGPVAGTAAGMEAAHGLRSLIHDTVKATADGLHERVRMETGGMSAAEIAEASDLATQLSTKYKSLSQTEILHSLRNMRSIVGTYEEAAKLLDPILKLRVVAMGAHPEHAAELAEDFDKLVKGMEIKGVTMDPAKFQSYMQGMAKAINVFGDTLRPTDYYEMFKYGRQATQGLSEKFMLETAPTLAQELGGSSAGKALSSFYQAIVGGRIKEQAVKVLDQYGMIDHAKVVRTKTGSIKGLLPGGVKGWEVAAHDPYAWVNDVLLPQLAKKGVTDPDKIQAILGTMFQAATAAQLAAIFATQQPRIEKDWNLVHGAQGLESADTFGAKDPYVAWQGVTSQFTNLLQVAGGPLGEPAAHVMNALATGIAAIGAAAKDHPALATGGLLTAATGLGGAALAGTLYGLRGIGSWMFSGAKAAGGAATEEGILSEAWTKAAAAAAPAATQSWLGWIASRTLGVAGAYFGSTVSTAADDQPLRYEPLSGRWIPREQFAARNTMSRWGAQDIGAAAPVPTGTSLDVARQYIATTVQSAAPAEGKAALEAVVKPDQITAKVEGNATLDVNLNVSPSAEFWTEVDSRMNNKINVFRNSGGAPATGTTGSKGESMPEVHPTSQ